MNVLADLREVADRFDEALTSVSGMRTREADPLDTGHVVDAREKIGEVTGGIIRSQVVIDDLPEELNFLAPGGDGLTDVGEDVGRGAHSLVTTRIRHDAERAVVVAAFDD